MKNKILCGCFLVAALLAVTSCASLLGTKPKPTDPVVTTGLATTNDVNAVAYINAARQLNAALNPTPTEPLINGILLGLGTIAAAAGGWYARNHTAKTTDAATLAQNQQTIAIAAASPAIPVSLIPPLIPPKA